MPIQRDTARGVLKQHPVTVEALRRSPQDPPVWHDNHERPWLLDVEPVPNAQMHNVLSRGRIPEDAAGVYGRGRSNRCVKHFDESTCRRISDGCRYLMYRRALP